MATKPPVPPKFVVRTLGALRTSLLRIADRLLPAPLAVAELGHQFARAHILAALWQLKVADAIGTSPVMPAELAGRLDCDPDALHRLLRAAATFGAVRMDSSGQVSATRLTRSLRSTDVRAAGAWCAYLSSPAHQQAWGDLATSIRTGEPAFARVHGQNLFDWFTAHPQEGEQFTQGLAGLTLSDAPFVVAALNPPQTGVVCDIAGGRGVLLAAILHQRPGLRAVLVESVDVLREAAVYLEQQGLLDRVELVAGDIFAPLTVTADLYLLKWILHDWDDNTCGALLKGIAATMPAGARLAVIEGIQDRNTVDPRFSMIDLEMLMVTDGGRERSAQEFCALITEAGLTPGPLRATASGAAVQFATA